MPKFCSSLTLEFNHPRNTLLRNIKEDLQETPLPVMWAMKKNWLYGAYRGLDLYYPLMWGLLHKPLKGTLWNAKNNEYYMESIRPGLFRVVAKGSKDVKK